MKFQTVNKHAVIMTICAISLLCINLQSVAQYQQSSSYSQQYSNQQGSYGSNSYNQSSYNQQNSGYSSGFGQSSRSSGRLSGRTTSSRSSRRSSNTDTSLTGNSAVNPSYNSAQTQSSRSSASQRSLTAPRSGMNAAPSVGGNGGGEVVIHSGNTGESKSKNASRASVPKPRFVSKTYLYLESSHLAVKMGEPFTVDVRLSGKAETKFDRLGFVLSYDPEMIKPVMDQRADGTWFDAQTMELPFAKNLEDVRIEQNEINVHDGSIHFSARLAEPLPAKTTTVARMIFVPVGQGKSTRIEFLSKSDEGNEALSFAQLGDQDVLGSSKDAFDGVIPLDIYIQDEASTSNGLIKSQTDKQGSSLMPATLHLVVDKHNVDVGNYVDLDIVLNNPAQLPVDEVEFLVMYNTRILHVLNFDTAQSQGLSSASGLDVNTEKGIMRYQGTFRKTKADAQTTIASIRFRATAPTTKTTFKVLVHKRGTLPSTGAYYKGQDILGDPSIVTDGVQTTSVSVRPTLSYLEHNKF